MPSLQTDNVSVLRNTTGEVPERIYSHSPAAVTKRKTVKGVVGEETMWLIAQEFTMVIVTLVAIDL